MSLLDELRTAGRLDSKGTFDLDPEEAREKLRKYQLTNPEKYILQFVQAAIVLGAEKLVFEIDSDEVEMRFDGDALGAEHLEDLFVHAFGRSTDRRMQAAKHLALGVISAEGIDPSLIEVDTGGDEGIRLQIRGDQTELRKDVEVGSNRIYLRERSRVEHLIEFLSRITPVHVRYREPITLEACRYARVPFVLNRKSFVDGRALEPRPGRRVERVETPTELGFVRYDPSTRMPCGLTLVQNGVIIEETHLELGDFPVELVVDTESLTPNLSYTGFVRNEAWHELVDEVLIPAVCRIFLRNTTRSLHQANPLLVAEFTNGLLSSRLRLLESYRTPSDILDETLMHLGDAEVWRLSSQRTSLAAALNIVGEGPIYFTTNAYPGVDATDENGSPLVDYFVAESGDYAVGDPRLLAQATGRRAIDITAQLQERHRQRIVDRAGAFSRLDGLRPRWPFALDHQRFDSPVVVEDGGLAVSVGVDPQSSLGVARFLVKSSADSLEKVHRDIPAINGLTFSVAGKEVESVARLLHDAAHLIPLAIMRYLEAPRTIHGAREPWASHAIAGLMQGTLHVEIGDAFGRAELPTPRFRWKGGKHRIFEGIDGEWRSVTKLGDTVEYVPMSSRARAVQIAYECRLTERENVVWLDNARQTIIELTRGPRVLNDVEEELANAARRIHRERGGLEEDAVLHGTYVLKRSLAGESTGEIGLTSRWTTSPGWIDLVILHEHKRLTTRRLPVPHGHFRAVVEDCTNPTEDLSDVVEDEDYERVVARLESVAVSIFEQFAAEKIDGGEGLDDAEELVLWRAIAESLEDEAHPHRLNWRIFRTSEGMRSYRQLAGRRRVYEEEPADDEIQIILPAVPGSRLELLSKIFGDDLASFEKSRPEPPVVEREVGPGPLVALRRALVRLAPDVEFEIEEGDDDLRFIARRFTLGRENSLVEKLERHPDDAAFLMAVWADPGRPAELV